MKFYCLSHLQAACSSLGTLFQKKVSAIVNILVIAIALALPAIFYLVVENISAASGNLGESTQLNVFLKPSISEQAAARLARELRKDPGIEQVAIINKQQGLNELQDYNGFAELLNSLETNPLPVVLEVQPVQNLDQAQALEELKSSLQKYSAVDLVQLDLILVKRLRAALEIGQHVIEVLAVLFGFTVIFIVGNTIRLELQTQHEQLEVSKLMGASNAFVRRPFLYTGAWIGLFAGIVACFIVSGVFVLLEGSVTVLANAYDSLFRLHGLNMQQMLFIIVFGIVFGVVGSWVSADRHLYRLDRG